MREFNQFDDYILETVRDEGFLPGRELVESLVGKFGVSAANGRKLVQRAVQKRLIASSKPATFGKGQFIYFSNENKLSFASIRPICEKYRPPVARVLDALAVNEGILSYYEALKICSSPLNDSSSKNSSLDELILMLVELKLIIMQEDSHQVRYMIDADVPEERRIAVMEEHYSKMVMDCVFVPDILRWLQKVNIIDNLKTIYRNKLTPSKGAAHNNLLWDAYGYTKTTGINSIVGAKADVIEKQTLVVLDVVINRQYEQFDVDGFLGRVQINLNSVKKGTRKVVPIVFYDEISEQALNTLRKLGFLSFNIDAIFGNKVHEIIKNVGVARKGIFSEDTGETQRSVARSLKAMRDAGQEENLANLKGTLFEYLFYPVFKSLYPDAMIIQGKTISEKLDNGGKERYEYDYIIQSNTPKELVVVELKGYSSEASIPLGKSDKQNTLSWFFGRTLPFAKKHYAKELSEGFRLRAAYITSAGFYPDGKKFLEAQAKYKSPKLSTHYDGRSLLSFLDENGFSHITKTVERYFVTKEDSTKIDSKTPVDAASTPF